MKVHFNSQYGIGDKIATVYSMENCGRQTGTRFKICASGEGKSITKQVCDLFHLNYVDYTEDCSNSIISIKVRGEQSTREYAQQGYIHYVARIQKELQERFGYDPKAAKPLKECTQLDYVAVQFDSRFGVDHGFSLTSDEIKLILKLHVNKDEKIKVVGGLSTIPYMNGLDFNYEYALGSLANSLDVIAGSSHYVGVDSGMAHLAGAIGIAADVYFKVPKWFARGGLNRNDGQSIPDAELKEGGETNPSLLEYYKCYPSVKTHDLSVNFW